MGNITPLGEPVQRLAAQILLRHLTFKLDAVGSVLSHGLHPLKALPSGQLLKSNLSTLEGPLQSATQS